MKPLQSTIQSYLFFDGRCDEAIEFYTKAIGAELEMLMRFNEAPDAPPEGTLAHGFEKKVMHASFRIGNSTIMASDGCGNTEDGSKKSDSNFHGFALSLTLATRGECEHAFSALQEGGEVTMPLGETFWSPCFGMVTDQFGVNWMVSIAQCDLE